VIIAPANHGVHTPVGPFNNKFFHIDASANLVVAASGAYDGAFGNLWNPFMAHIFPMEVGRTMPIGLITMR